MISQHCGSSDNWSSRILQIMLGPGEQLPGALIGKLHHNVEQPTIKDIGCHLLYLLLLLNTDTRIHTHRLTNLANVMWHIKSSVGLTIPWGLDCAVNKSLSRNLQAPVNIQTATAQEWYTVLSSSPSQWTDNLCRGLMGIAPSTPDVGLDGGLSIVTEPCVGPQQLLHGHPGVPGPHRGCIYCWLHHQAGQQCQETC